MKTNYLPVTGNEEIQTPAQLIAAHAPQYPLDLTHQDKEVRGSKAQTAIGSSNHQVSKKQIWTEVHRHTQAAQIWLTLQQP